MSKKQLLSEVRRFMKLANVNSGLTSNFVKTINETDWSYNRGDEPVQEEEEYGEEAMMGDEDGLEADLGADMMDDEAGLEADLEADLGADMMADEDGDAAALVQQAAEILQQLGALAGVEVEVESDDEYLDDEPIEDEYLDDEVIDDDDLDVEMPDDEEQSLEEMIDSLMQETEDKPEDELGPDFIDRAKAEELAKLKALAATEEPHERDRKTNRRNAPVRPIHQENIKSVKVVDDERLVREITKRVKARLARIIKNNRRK